jgi:signal transduction histidine kinase
MRMILLKSAFKKSLQSSLKNSGWLLAGFAIAVLGLGLSSIISYRNTERIVVGTEQSLQSYEVIRNLADVLTNMSVAESGRRGYVFLNDLQELERYHNAVDRLEVELKALQHQLKHNPEQLSRLQQVEELLNQRLELLQESILLYNQKPQITPKQLQLTRQSVKLRNQIQQLLAQMEMLEEESLKRGLSNSQSSIRNRTTIELWLTISIVASLVLGLIAFYHQILKRQQVEHQRQQLAQQTELNEMKLRFFSMVSHEFRTPLTVILGSTQLMLEDKGLAQPKQLPHPGPSLQQQNLQQHSLQRVQSAAKNMIQLLNDMLTLTRADAGRLDYYPTSVELVSFCLNLIEDLNLTIEERDRIQFLNQTEFNYAHLDEKLLYSLLGNLLTNALKYDPECHPVQLILQGNEEMVRFIVQDHGIGISANNREHLFEPFYRGDNVRSIAGTGLGLAVVKKCVDLHCGKIEIESQEGQGTKFWVNLPRQPVSQTAT